MTIAELFVNLGVKGDSKAQQALGGVRGTLGEIKTSSLAAKAGILAVVYGLQRLMQNSADAGASLMSYSAATGLSAETLQRWQYAARQANVGAEEMENAITGVQSAMIKLSMGQGVPAGMGVISNAVGIDQKRIRDTMYMIGKLSEYAMKEKNVDFANEQLKSFGLSLQMISAMRRNAFNATNLANAPIYSNAEADKLQRVDVQWANMFKKFEMGMGHLNAKHGLSLVRDLSKVSDQLLRMLDLFAKMIEKTAALQALSALFDGWATDFKLIADAAELFTSAAAPANGPMTKEEASSSINQPLFKLPFTDKFRVDKIGSPGSILDSIISSGVRNKVDVREPSKVINNNTNVTAHIQGVKDAKDVGQHVKREINRAGRLSPAQGRAN